MSREVQFNFVLHRALRLYILLVLFQFKYIDPSLDWCYTMFKCTNLKVCQVVTLAYVTQFLYKDGVIWIFQYFKWNSHIRNMT